MTVGSTHIGRANTPFVNNRLASQLIQNPLKRPVRPVPSDVFHGPVTPPLRDFDPKRLPLGMDTQRLLDFAWSWRNRDVTPEDGPVNVRFVRESELQEMEKYAPQVAAIARQQAEEAREAMSRGKLTRVIARTRQLIIDQYGWPDRD